MKKKAAIYARVSTSDKQDYQRQVNELKLIAIKDGYQEEDIETFAESISGYKRDIERVKLQELQQKIEENKDYFGCVYTSEISRIGRNPNHTRQVIDRWSELGVPLYIQSLNQSTISPDGSRNMIMNIILQVLMEYANEEAKIFKTRSKSGLLNSARDGKAGGGRNLPYGFKKGENKKLIINEEEAIVILKIFNLYRDGNGIKVISKLLNEQKIPTRVNISYDKDKIIKFKKIPKLSSDVRWSDKQIHDIIKNPIYKGQRRFKGEYLIVPPIITEELFDECTLIRETKRTRNITSTYTYLLKDLIICGRCGRNYYARYKPVKGGDKVYKCSSSLTVNKSCGNCGINIKLIESIIFYEMVQSKSLLKYLDDRKEIKKEIKSTIIKLKNQITIDEKSLKEKSNEDDRLFQSYLRGVGSIDRYEKNQIRIQNEINLLTQKIRLLKKDLMGKTKILSELNSVTPSEQMLMDSKNDRLKLRIIFNQLIHKIIVNKIDIDTVLVCIFLKFDNEVVKTSAKFILDIGGIKKKEAIYRYSSMFHMENEPVFDNNNRLLTDLDEMKKEIVDDKNKLLNEMFLKEFNEDKISNLSPWIYVSSEYLVDIY